MQQKSTAGRAGLRIALVCSALVTGSAATSWAQVASVVGPDEAPVGCPIQINISNDTSVDVGTGVCPFLVLDASQSVIYDPICIQILANIDPGGTFNTEWPQIDDTGNQVAPGLYVVRVFEPDGDTTDHPIAIGDFAAGVAPLGVARVGTTRNYRLCAPDDGNGSYLMAAAFTNNVGIATCGGTLPLDMDGLFVLSQTAPATFQNFSGLLDPAGESSAPAIAIPPLPGLAGTSFLLAFGVLDPSDPTCVVETISSNLLMTIQ